MRRGLLIFIFLSVFISSLLYFVPQFINFNKYKDRLTKEIETAFEIPIKIDGDINISILPHVYISAKDIKILTSDRSSTVISIKNIYIELSIQELLNIDTTQLTKIILSELSMDLTDNIGKESKRDVLSKVLSGNLFNKIKTVKIQNSELKYFDEIENKNDIVHDINLNITKKIEDQKTYIANGTFILRKLKSNIKSTFIISDLDNYDTIADINYKQSKSENLQLNLKISKRQDLFNIIGDINIKSNDLGRLIQNILPSFPNLKLTDGQSKLSSKIQFTNNTLQMNDLQITNKNTFSTGLFNYDLKTKDKNLKLHYKNFFLPDHIQTDTDKISLLKQIISKVKNIKINITTESFKLTDIKIHNFDLKAEIKENNILNITEFKLASDKINGNFNGDLSVENDNLKLNINIAATTNFKYSLANLNPIIINSFDGNITGTYDNFFININSIKTNAGLLSGKLSKQKSTNNKYNVNLNSESINLDNILTKNIFDFIKSKNQIELFKNGNFLLNINANNLIMQKTNMKTFSFAGNIDHDLISISKLNWDAGDYNISISGKLEHITQDSGTMNNINYEIKSFNFGGVKIGYLSQIPFLPNLLQKESGTIKFTLNGYAGNPNILINGKTSNMNLVATIKHGNHQKKDIDITINHNNSKMFINQLYGDVYTTTQRVLKDNGITLQTNIINDGKNIIFKNISIISNGQKLNGNVSISGIGKISANLESKKIDLTKLIKNSNDDYKQNLIIYALNNTGSNINLKINRFKTYTRTYSNVNLQINKSKSNPDLLLSADLGNNANIEINSTINGNQYNGNIKLKNIEITEPFFNINNYDILNGLLSSNINFETFGVNKNEIISNLSGNITVDFTDGRLIGFSGKDIIENKIYSSPIIMTNDVIQTIEEELTKGESDFNTITINANITGGTIENGQIIINTNDISINGSLNADIPNKQFGISGAITILNILPMPANAVYKISGDSTNVKKEVTLESIISKVNPTFFKMKKREYLNKQEKSIEQNKNQMINQWEVDKSNLEQKIDQQIMQTDNNASNQKIETKPEQSKQEETTE